MTNTSVLLSLSLSLSTSHSYKLKGMLYIYRSHKFKNKFANWNNPVSFISFFTMLNWIQEKLKHIKWFEQETLHIESCINVKAGQFNFEYKIQIEFSISICISGCWDDMRCKDPFVDKSCVIVSCRGMGEAELGRDLSPIIYSPNDTIICLIFIIQYRR